MNKPKLNELDLLRALAIMAVVLIHGTSEGSSVEEWGRTAPQLLMLAVNKLSAFAVPVFIFISGIVLFYGTGAAPEWDAGSVLRFYRRRLQTVLVPYLLWSAAYYAVNQWLAHGWELRLDPVYFAKLLLTGNASYHLYFLVIILQFYAVFPLLSLLTARLARLRRHLFMAGVLVQAAFYGFERLVHKFPFSYLCGFSYASFFALGGAIGLAYASSPGLKSAWLHRSAPFAVGCGLAYAALFAAGEWGLEMSTVWYEALFVAYGIAAGLALLGLARRWLRRPRTSSLLRSIGHASFGIYLLHPLLLSLWRVAVPAMKSGEIYLAVNSLGVAAVFAVSWGVTSLYRRWASASVKRRSRHSAAA